MSSKNVFIMTCGGLGNQLFQIAFGFYLLQHDISVYVPDIYKLTAYPGENRHTYWDTFPCPFHKISKKDFPTSMKVLGDHEISSYQNITSQNTQVYGHFQKYVFVEKSLPQIKTWLKNMNHRIDSEIGKIKYDSRDCISLHVRRGDYVKMSHVHNVLSIHYYSDALSHFDDKLPLIVFSNDIPWCREHFEMFSREIHYVSDDIPDYIQLGMMSKIKYNIIANSTFSWWAAVLNENADKKVVSPKEWLCNSKYNLSRPEWIEISDQSVYF